VQQELISLIQTVHRTSINPRNSEVVHELAREARSTLTDLLKQYNNPKTRPEAEETLTKFINRKDV